MMTRMRNKVGLCTLALVMSVSGSNALASDTSNWLAIAEQTQSEMDPAVPKAQPAPVAGWEKPIPITLSFDYTLASKYIWRGQDLTPDNNYMNHQMTIGAELDLGDFGTLGANVWFQSNAGTGKNNTDTNVCIQEVDYTVYWGYTIEPIGLSTEIGFIYYTFPHQETAFNTQELYFSLGWDDGILWKALGMDCGAIFNPTFAMYFDIDETAGGVWGEFGLSHEFALAEMGCADVAVLKDITFGVSWTLGFASNYAWTANYSGPMTSQYGVDMNLDLKSMLGLPDQGCGDLYLKGFLYYNQALTNNKGAAGMADTLWGGMSIGYAW